MSQVVNIACIGALATLFAGCHQQADAEPGIQVIATVNDHEITRAQLAAAGDALGTDTNTAVESLIDEELLVQKALADRLDRDPEVVRQIEHAGRQILARAYVERSVLTHAEISAQTPREYYGANPALFAQRRIYRTLTFSIPRIELTQALRDALDRSQSAIQVRQLLDRRHVAFEAVETTRPAEEIPTDILPQLEKAAPGDVLIAAPPQQTHALLICVVDTHASPIDFEHARALITQQLTEARDRESVARYLQHARSQARISYTASADAAVASVGKAQ